MQQKDREASEFGEEDVEAEEIREVSRGAGLWGGVMLLKGRGEAGRHSS